MNTYNDTTHPGSWAHVGIGDADDLMGKKEWDDNTEQQWVVVCMPPNYDEEVGVYGAWETKKEATDWLAAHLVDRVADDNAAYCELGASDLDHYTVTVRDID